MDDSTIFLGTKELRELAQHDMDARIVFEWGCRWFHTQFTVEEPEELQVPRWRSDFRHAVREMVFIPPAGTPDETTSAKWAAVGKASDQLFWFLLSRGDLGSLVIEQEMAEVELLSRSMGAVNLRLLGTEDAPIEVSSPLADPSGAADNSRRSAVAQRSPPRSGVCRSRRVRRLSRRSPFFELYGVIFVGWPGRSDLHAGVQGPIWDGSRRTGRSFG